MSTVEQNQWYRATLVSCLVSQPMTAYASHLSWQLLVATFAAASGTPVVYPLIFHIYRLQILYTY